MHQSQPSSHLLRINLTSNSDLEGLFQGSYGQPRETTQHLLGPICATFRPTKFKFHYVAPHSYFSADRPNCAKFPSLKCAHISLWLNPTVKSKFHNTSNHPPPATDSCRTARTSANTGGPPYSLPPFFPVPDRETGENLCPCQACATTACSECAR